MNKYAWLTGFVYAWFNGKDKCKVDDEEAYNQGIKDGNEAKAAGYENFFTAYEIYETKHLMDLLL